jgi:hypothetical protein
VEVGSGYVVVVERTTAVAEQFADECDCDRVGIVGLLERGCELQ